MAAEGVPDHEQGHSRFVHRGDGGRQVGQFFGVHSIAIDSKGNLYTTETYQGRRVQKFVAKGVGSIPRKDMGVVWPTSTGR